MRFHFILSRSHGFEAGETRRPSSQLFLTQNCPSQAACQRSFPQAVVQEFGGGRSRKPIYFYSGPNLPCMISPSVLFWFCRSMCWNGKYPLSEHRALRCWSRSRSEEQHKLLWCTSSSMSNLFCFWEGRSQSSLVSIFICNNCFTYSLLH